MGQAARKILRKRQWEVGFQTNFHSNKCQCILAYSMLSCGLWSCSPGSCQDNMVKYMSGRRKKETLVQHSVSGRLTQSPWTSGCTPVSLLAARLESPGEGHRLLIPGSYPLEHSCPRLGLLVVLLGVRQLLFVKRETEDFKKCLMNWIPGEWRFTLLVQSFRLGLLCLKKKKTAFFFFCV